MNPKNECGAAFRLPTANERNYIIQSWSKQLRGRYHANSGKIVTGLAVAGLILLILDVLVAPTVLSDKVILASGIYCCFSVGNRAKKWARRIGNMIDSLEQGRFCVLPAVAESVRFNRGSRLYEGFARISLDRGLTYGEYRLTYEETSQLQKEKASNFPVLLVKLDGEQEMLAVADRCIH